MDHEVILEVKALTQYFISNRKNTNSRYTPFLQNINFSVKEGEVFGIVGESGCGKSTLGKYIAALFDLYTGQILFRGKDIKKWLIETPEEYRSNVQIIFQNPRSALNMNMRIKDLIREAISLKIKKVKNQTKSNNIDLEVNKILKSMQIDHKSDDYSHQLSGGERRRAGLGRVLAVNPSLIIADEPVSSLDISYKGLIIKLILDYKIKNNATIIFISHDIHLVNQICNRVAVMFKGILVEIFRPQDYGTLEYHQPYTKELFDAAGFFKPDSKGFAIFEQLQFVDAESTEFSGKGCPYFYRCKMKEKFNTSEKCQNVMPELIQINQNQQIACHAIANAIKKQNTQDQ